MSKQNETNKLLRAVGLKTKNANFDANCKVCGTKIRGKAPKHAVVCVNLPTESRKKSWIHTSCIDVDKHLLPEDHKMSGQNIAYAIIHNGSSMKAFKDAYFADEDRDYVHSIKDGGWDNPKPKTPPKESKTPPKENKDDLDSLFKENPLKPVKVSIPTAASGEAGDVLAGLVAPSLIGMVSNHVQSEIASQLAAMSLPRPLVVKPLGKDSRDLEVGLTHPCFEHALDLAKIRANAYSCGAAGSGKTFAAKQIFETLLHLPKENGGFANKNLTLDDNFVILSCHNEMMPSDIVGGMIPQINPKDGGEVEVHRMSDIVKVYRDGGVLVFDEFPCLVGGTAIAANAALAGDTWRMPDGKVVRRSDDLWILATGNTLGQGSGRSGYIANETLDISTLNRFAGGVIHWGYDRAFERELIQDDEIVNFFHEVRSKADSAGIRRIISPRHMQTAYKQKHVLGWNGNRWRTTALADWNEKDLRAIGYDKSFIEDATGNGGAA